jgi:hypothetical protein
MLETGLVDPAGLAAEIEAFSDLAVTSTAF